MACGVGPIQVSPRVDDGLGEVGVLGEEAVAGVHRVGAGPGGDVDELVDAQVGIGSGLAAQGVRFVGEHGVQGLAVGVRVHGDAAQAGILAGADDADGDLATVGDEYLAHLGGSSRSLLTGSL